MDKRTIVLIVFIFGLIVVGMFVFAYIKHNELKIVEPSKTQVLDTTTEYSEISRVDAKHFYEDGKHTFVGSLDFKTPCDLLTTSSVVRESMPEQVELQFSVVNHSQNCEEKITEQRFKLEISASEAAVFSAKFMGRTIDLNLIPALPGERPDDFEIYIKG